MSEKSIAEKIDEIDKLRKSGALTEDEFQNLKKKILDQHLSSPSAAENISEKFSEGAANAISVVGDAFSDSEKSFKSLAWGLYWGVVATNIIGFIPVFFWVSTLAGIAILIISGLKLNPSNGTIYNSHFFNIFITGIVAWAGILILLFFVFGTLGLGLLLAVPLALLLFIWTIYRIVKGMLRLNAGKAY